MSKPDDALGRIAARVDNALARIDLEKGERMSQVTVPVNARSYTLICDDGQEPRIRRLAQYLDAKVAEFVAHVGQVGEARLLPLAALVIADELSDAKDALERERNGAQTADAKKPTDADGINGVAKRVEAIAARLETP